VGGGKTVTANETMELQDCGVSAGTFWVADLNNAHIGYTPFLNGADTTFTHPLVLSVVSIKQGLRLRLERLNLLTGNYVPNEDMWTLTFGVELCASGAPGTAMSARPRELRHPCCCSPPGDHSRCRTPASSRRR
jgi:hypothetical protein